MKKLCFTFLIFFSTISSFAQNNSFTDKRDSKTYKTVKIGLQTWMAENLAFKADSNCWAYDNDQSNLAKYGYLYNWETAKYVCPSGWHLPSKTDYETLLNNLGESGSVAYQALLLNGSSGFSAITGGSLDEWGGFRDIEHIANFWSSSPSDDFNSWLLFLGAIEKVEDGTMHFRETLMANIATRCGLSVRCLKDN